jgi:hypothetical protein
MRQCPARQDQAVNLFIGHSIFGKRLDRSEREALLNQSGQIRVRVERIYAKFDLDAAKEHGRFASALKRGCLDHSYLLSNMPQLYRRFAKEANIRSSAMSSVKFATAGRLSGA